MRRFFLEKTAFEGETVVLTGDEARHVFTVLRMRPGDEVLLINGEGVECVARIDSASNEAVSLSILESRSCSADPFVCVTLFQCLPKQGKMEVIIQKCVELGVFAIVPTVSKRCVVKPEGMDKKLVRWNKVSQEAAKQCGRANVPKVTEALYLDKADFSGYDTVLAAYENESERTLKSALRSLQGSKSIAIIIGPEGGFEPGEVESILDKGGTAVSLGRRILRTETAGMAMLAQIMYELEQ